MSPAYPDGGQGASRVSVLYIEYVKELWYLTRIPCFRICLYNRCTCLEVLWDCNPDRKIQENRSRRCWAIGVLCQKPQHHAKYAQGERKQTNNLLVDLLKIKGECKVFNGGIRKIASSCYMDH